MELLYNGIEPLLRIVLVGTLSYVALVIMLRLSGKRTLSRLDAFDLVISMALGSILAKIMLTKDVVVSEAAVAFGLLIVLQVLTSRLSMRFPFFCRLINSPPVLLYHDGLFQQHVMKKERVSREEIESAMLQKGIGDIANVAAVILCSNGKLAIIPKDHGPVALPLHEEGK